MLTSKGLWHAPYSLDLTYWLFLNRKKWLVEWRYASNEDIKAEINAYFAKFYKPHYIEGIEKLESRWKTKQKFVKPSVFFIRLRTRDKSVQKSLFSQMVCLSNVYYSSIAIGTLDVHKHLLFHNIIFLLIKSCFMF